MTKTVFNTTLRAGALMLTGLLVAQSAQAAISLDRTRVILNGGSKSETLTVTNQNKELPYLAQAWVEDENGKKIESPVTALPPLQRVEPGGKGQVKVQVTSDLAALPQDRESVFYFNVREIPPKSNKPNTLQIALQTRVKLFYRPAALEIKRSDVAAQKQVTLTRNDDVFTVNNPTPYYLTISNASSAAKGKDVSGFKPVMVAPKGSATLPGSASALGNAPVLTYINDYGGRPQLTFSCGGSGCAVSSMTAG
ncbi:fimbria/pilus periplasmic chaperone [Lelliottia nimipressuralis]